MWCISSALRYRIIGRVFAVVCYNVSSERYISTPTLITLFHIILARAGSRMTAHDFIVSKVHIPGNLCCEALPILPTTSRSTVAMSLCSSAGSVLGMLIFMPFVQISAQDNSPHTPCTQQALRRHGLPQSRLPAMPWQRMSLRETQQPSFVRCARCGSTGRRSMPTTSKATCTGRSWQGDDQYAQHSFF